MSRATKFWDKIADKYSNQPIEDEAAYQKKLQVTQDYLHPDMDVLEFGCGTGSTAIIHAPHVKHIRAVDISANMLDIARRKAKSQQITNITFEQSAIDDLTVPNDCLDAVLGLSILHLLEDKEAVIDRVHQMLKPGGLFVTSTTCLGETMPYFRFFVPIGQVLGIMPFVQVFTVPDLIESLTDAGFKIDYQWQPAKGKAVFIIAKK